MNEKSKSLKSNLYPISAQKEKPKYSIGIKSLQQQINEINKRIKKIESDPIANASKGALLTILYTKLDSQSLSLSKLEESISPVKVNSIE